MSITVYTEIQDGKFKKNALEAVSYAKALAEKSNDELIAIAFGDADTTELYKYGANKVLVHKNTNAHKISPEVIGKFIAEKADSKIVVFSNSIESSSYAPFIAHNLGASIITNVISVPESISPLKVKRNTFSGKGLMLTEAKQDKVVLTIQANSFGVKENLVEGVTEEISFDNQEEGKITIENIEANSAKLDLKEASIVVSGGRGLKGPENWGMLEELAESLGAAMATTKPVSDMGWRSHSEHVGQTGKAIAPDLYIAVGISGAIQHLAGVNASKNIVVINSDSEAPFFNSANYGIVGDAFEVVPKLTEAIKKMKS